MNRKLGLSILISLLLLKVIGVVMRGPSPIVLDAKGYWELGGLVADGDWLLTGKQIAFRTPGYPWLIGIIRSIFGQPLAALVGVQALLWLGTIAISAVLAKDLSGNRNSIWIVLGCSALMISSLVYITTVLTETMFVFTLMLHLWAVARFARQPSATSGIMMGLSLALSILTRPIAILVWIADAIYLLATWYTVLGRDSRRPSGRELLIGVSLAVVVVTGSLTPWLERNRAMFGKRMLTEFVGRNIWIVTFQDGSGAGLDFPDTSNGRQLRQQIGGHQWDRLQQDASWRMTWTISRALTGSGLDDAAGDRLMKSVALDAIGQKPFVFAGQACRRAINFWRTRATELPVQAADLKTQDRQIQPDLFAKQDHWGVKVAPVDTAIRLRWSNWLTGNTLLMLVTLSATMLLIWSRSSRAIGLWLGGILCYFCLVTAVLEIPAYRYRMIVEPIVVVVIACAISNRPAFPKPSVKTAKSE